MNPLKQARELLDKVKSLPDWQNRVFIRMSSVAERPTFNPIAEYMSTPPGTYAYPMWYVLELSQSKELDLATFTVGVGRLPYQYDAPYIHLFYAKDPDCFLHLKPGDVEDRFVESMENLPFIRGWVDVLKEMGYYDRYRKDYAVIFNRYVVGSDLAGVPGHNVRSAFLKFRKIVYETAHNSLLHLKRDELDSIFSDIARGLDSNKRYYGGLEDKMVATLLETFLANFDLPLMEKILFHYIQENISQAYRLIREYIGKDFLEPLSDVLLNYRLFVKRFKEGDSFADRNIKKFAKAFEDYAALYVTYPSIFRFAMGRLYHTVNPLVAQRERKSFKFYRNIGYCGIYDWGTKAVHEAEPVQVVWWDMGAVEHIGTMLNPYHLLEGYRAGQIREMNNRMLLYRLFSYSSGYRYSTSKGIYMDLAYHMGEENAERVLQLIGNLIRRGKTDLLRSVIYDVAKFRLMKYTFVGEWNEIERRSDVVYKPDFEILRDILDEMVEASAAFTTEYALKILEGQYRISTSVRFQDELVNLLRIPFMSVVWTPFVQKLKKLPQEIQRKISSMFGNILTDDHKAKEFLDTLLDKITTILIIAKSVRDQLEERNVR